jgi:uncharacterized protein
MTEPGYQGAPTPDPNAPQAPGVPGQYQPPAGAPIPPGPVAPPPGYPTADDKQWALIAHFGGAAGALFCGMLAFVMPLVAYIVKKDSPVARQHAVAALNFQIPVAAVGLVFYIISVAAGFSFSAGGAALSLLFFFLRLVVLLVGVIFGVIAGMKANEGQLYKYPVSFPIVK